jgi:pimeloyl-ACP methyl ester carboxylesterase
MSLRAGKTERPRRALRLPTPETHPFRADDGAELMLTRYRGGPKGPVIVAPGYGTPSRSMAIDTVETNFAEFLVEHSYDVWTFDYRASPDLEVSKTDYTMDDVARRDYPAAVAEVLTTTGADDVQVMAHCMGSMGFAMALLDGLRGVRSGICSQVAMHPIGQAVLKFKTSAKVSSMLDAIGIDRMSSDYDADELDDRMMEAVMKHFPTREKCNNPTCHRLLFIYGEVYSHAQLNEETHQSIHEIFGRGAMPAFSHISTIVAKERVVDEHGDDVYLPNVGNAAIPLMFLHGENNNFFLPEGTEKTYDFLKSHNGDDLYSRRVVPGYAHMDCFIGKDAARDVFPLLVDELDRFN